MFKKKFSKQFDKKILKLRGKEASNVIKKIYQILNCENINHYKNLKNDLKDFKRVHINIHFVILFKLDKKSNIIYFYKYEHHNKIYN